MKNSTLILLIASSFGFYSKLGAQTISLNSISEAKDIQKKLPLSVNVDAKEWYLVDLPAVKNKTSLPTSPINPMKGSSTLSIVNKGAITLKSCNLSFTTSIPIINNGKQSHIKSLVTVTGIINKDITINGRTISPKGTIDNDGFFVLPWILKLKIAEFPDQEYVVHIQTWGFIGKDALGKGVNYGDFGILMGIEPSTTIANLKKFVDTQTLNKGGKDKETTIYNCNGCNKALSEKLNQKFKQSPNYISSAFQSIIKENYMPVLNAINTMKN